MVIPQVQSYSNRGRSLQQSLPVDRPSYGGVHHFDGFGFHSRASFSASAICNAVMRFAIRSRVATASLLPRTADRLNHICARTSSCGTPSPFSHNLSSRFGECSRTYCTAEGGSRTNHVVSARSLRQRDIPESPNKFWRLIA